MRTLSHLCALQITIHMSALLEKYVTCTVHAYRLQDTFATLDVGEERRGGEEEGGEERYARGWRFGLMEVPSHNDLLSGNILRHQTDPPSEDSPLHLTLIDYEYVCINHRAFDIANHFCGECIYEGLGMA